MTTHSKIDFNFVWPKKKTSNNNNMEWKTQKRYVELVHAHDNFFQLFVSCLTLNFAWSRRKKKIVQFWNWRPLKVTQTQNQSKISFIFFSSLDFIRMTLQTRHKFWWMKRKSFAFLDWEHCQTSKSATTTHKSRQKFGFLFMRSRSSFRLCGLLTWRRMCHEFYRLNWCLPEFRKFHLNFEFRFDFLATLTHTHTRATMRRNVGMKTNENRSVLIDLKMKNSRVEFTGMENCPSNDEKRTANESSSKDDE